MEPEILPPGSSEDAGFEGVRVRMAHVKSLGAVGALLALLTMGAALGFGFLMLFGRSLLAAAVVVLLWPYVFSAEFTRFVFGADAAPFWKVFLLMVLIGTLAKALLPSSSRK
ncbi:MAG: hypothetical protein KGJ84_10635 [Elusimicrobia bacterium]|nr:hypothetical protein [Elusimicrobiota bacterium]